MRSTIAVVSRHAWLLGCVLLLGAVPVPLLGADGQAAQPREAAAPAEKGNSPEAKAKAPADSDAGEAKKDSKIFAEIHLTGEYPEGAQLPGLFGDLTESLGDAIERLEKASKDDRVAGVILKLDDPGELRLNWSTAYAFRRAIASVQKAEKPVYCWMSMAETPGYLVASACDRVFMPESGALMVLGLRAEVTFYKNLFDKLDIRPEMLRVGKFKSAAEPYTRTEMSPEFREEMEELLEDLYQEMIAAIAAGRKLDAEPVKDAIDQGPLVATTARELKLIDEFAYEDQVAGAIAKHQGLKEAKVARRYAKKKIDTDFSGLDGFLKFMDLLAGVDRSASVASGPKIAVIYATGAILSGESKSGLLSSSVLGSETLTKAIDKARDDDNVKAIVLRVNSPGGSALASDIIWRSVQLAKAKKPVLVSMGSVAASGGYYIAMGADAIVAEPTTITGSIGVVGGKLAFSGLLEKIGVTTSVVTRGKNSSTLSLISGFSESERAAMQKMLDDIYRQFTSKAAQGREMPLDQLQALAGGRIYSGKRADELKLVDQIGTLEDTIELAKARAREKGLLEPDADVRIESLPKPKSPLEELFGPLNDEASLRTDITPARVAGAIDPRLAELFAGAEIIHLLARERVLTVMPFTIQIR